MKYESRRREVFYNSGELADAEPGGKKERKRKDGERNLFHVGLLTFRFGFRFSSLLRGNINGEETHGRREDVRSISLVNDSPLRPIASHSRDLLMFYVASIWVWFVDDVESPFSYVVV